MGFAIFSFPRYNVYLNELDQFIKHQLLEQHLKLTLNPKKIIQPIQQGG